MCHLLIIIMLLTPLSESEYESAGETSFSAVYPSDSLGHSTENGAIYPSKSADSESADDMSRQKYTVPLFSADNSNDLDTTSESDSAVLENTYVPHPKGVVPRMYDSDEERDQVGILLVSKCCDKNCLLHLNAFNLLSARKSFPPWAKMHNDNGYWIRSLKMVEMRRES